MLVKKHKVLIGSPICQQPEILSLFFESLERLHQCNIELSYFFIDDNDDPKSSALISRFIEKSGKSVVYQSHKDFQYTKNETTHFWNEYLVWRVADFKNKILQYALNMEFDYLFLVDSDLMLFPSLLEHLVEQQKEIISEVFWTRWQPDAMPQPQVWLKDEYTQWEQARGESLSDEEKQARYMKFIAKLVEPGVYEVGGLGACTLISRSSMEKGVNFNPIPNLSFWGEDRHFCVRAAALGIPMHVDTHYPAFHIYRESDLSDGAEFIKKTSYKPPVKPLDRRRPAITLSMVVCNEGSKMLREVLESHLSYIDQAVIIDDGSTDNTVDICKEVLGHIPLTIISNEHSRFHNEVELRKQQWEETIKVHPEWILNLDADEVFEARFAEEIGEMVSSKDVDVYCFRLYDFWNKHQYREDEYWSAHTNYRPFLVRYRSDFQYTWKDTPQHCGRFPENIFSLSCSISPLRLKHYGWASRETREAKYERYLRLDPQAEYGWKEQYESILDEKPRLIEWIE